MATVCQVYDEATGTILFDLNDPTGANVGDNGYTKTITLQAVDTGTPEWENTRFAPPMRDGGPTSFRRGAWRTVRIPFIMQSASVDLQLQAMGRLNQHLQAGCVLRFRLDGATLYQYIDVEPSSTAYFVDGRELALFDAATMVTTGPGGVTLQLTAQPYLRGDTLDSATNILTNATLLIDADGAGTPDNWVWDSTANITGQNIDAAAEAYEFTIATTGTRNLQQVTANSSVTAALNYISAIEAKASAGGIARLTVGFQGMTNAGANQGTESTSTQTTLNTVWQRIPISAAAQASVTKTRISLRMANAVATSVDVQFRFVQAKQESTISPFCVGNESGVSDPNNYGGRVFPIVNPGSAWTSARLTMANSTLASTYGVVSVLPAGAYPGKGDTVEYLNSHACVLQFEDWTNGTDTAVNTAANSSPGSGNTGKKTTFATTTLVTRATYTLTDATKLAALRGRTWLVMLRCAAADANYNGVVQFGSPGTLTGSELPDLTSTAVAFTTAFYMDVPLGLVTFADDPAFTSQDFEVLASRTSGTGNLIWDCITFVPAPAAAIVGFNTSVNTTLKVVTDGETNQRVVVNSSGVIVERNAMTPSGPTPVMIPPGLSMLYVLFGTDNSVTWSDTAIINGRADVLSVASKLKPRYL